MSPATKATLRFLTNSRWFNSLSLYMLWHLFCIIHGIHTATSHILAEMWHLDIATRCGSQHKRCCQGSYECMIPYLSVPVCLAEAFCKTDSYQTGCSPSGYQVDCKTHCCKGCPRFVRNSICFDTLYSPVTDSACSLYTAGSKSADCTSSNLAPVEGNHCFGQASLPWLPSLACLLPL